jgi:hypothetical protein
MTCVIFLEKVHHQDIGQYHVTPLLCRSNRCSVTSIVSEYTFLEMGVMYTLSSPVHREEVTAHHFHNDALPGHQIPDRNTFCSITCYMRWQDKCLYSCGQNRADQAQSTHWRWKTELWCHSLQWHTQHCSYSTHLPFNCLVNHSWAVPTCKLRKAGLCPCSYRSGILNSHNWHQRALLNPHRATASQFRFLINIWEGITVAATVGPACFLLTSWHRQFTVALYTAPLHAYWMMSHYR